jgi:hypothetical protein
VGNGAVLAAGDEPSCGIEATVSDTAELWLPRKGRWARADRMPVARTMTTLIGLADGRAMVTGGANQQYVAKSGTVVYDPERRAWSRSGNLNTARMEFAAAPLADGGVLVAGGLLIGFAQDPRWLRTAERWDPRTGRWSEVRPLARPRTDAEAVTLSDGRVLVVGGFDGDMPVATAEIFDPATGRWRAAGRLSAPRDGFSMVALTDGGALVVGGSLVDSGGRASRAERFDPVTRSWSRDKGASPIGERPAAVVLGDGRVLVVSGRVAMTYDPATRRWTDTARLPGGMWEASAVLLRDGSVLVGGGWTRAAAEGETPGCPTYSSRTWRFVPGA